MSEIEQDFHQDHAPEIAPDLQKYVPEVQEFIKTWQEVFFAIAGDRSLSFKPGQGFAIDLQKGEITLDVHDWKWAQ